MKIENVDAFKQWLVSVLNPIFDGDPDKLALYIVALVRKIENDQESRVRCITDLEVFLESNTNSFVESLFDTLVLKKYLNSAQQTNTTTAAATTTTTTAVSNSAQPSSNTNTNINSDYNSKSDDNSNRKKDFYESSRYQQNDRERDRSRRFNSNNNSYDDNRRAQQRHSNDHYSNRGGSYRARLSRDYQEIDSARNRSRSRSSKTRHKNRSRNRIHRGASSSSSSSSSSPTLNTSSSRRFDGERKNTYRRSYSRSRSFSPRNRLVSNDEENTSVKKQRCHDFDEKGYCTQAELCPFDHGVVVIAPLMSSNSTAGQQSSLLNSANSIDQQESNQLGIASNNNNNNFSMNNQMYNPNSNDMYQMPRHQRNNQQRRNNNGQQMKPTGPGLLPMPNNFNGQQPPGRFSNQRNNPMNNNNGNGFNNPNQINNNVQSAPQVNNPNSNDLFNLPLQQRQMISNRPRNLVNIPTSIHQDDQLQSNDQISNVQTGGFMNNQPPQPQAQHRGIKRSYYNNNNNNNNNFNNVNNQPVFGQDQNSFGFQQPQHNPTFNNQPQQMPALLPTPSPLPLQQQQPITQLHNQNNQQPLQASMNKPGFNQGAGNNNQNTAIILRRVPIDLNRVDKMRQHFSKFGQIVDIKCHYENNSDATLIQFATNQQAFAAYKCPQSVFNNRFIRICWLSNHQKQQQQQQQQSLQPQINQTALNTDEPQVKRPVKDRLSFNNNFDDQSDKDMHSLNEIKNKENKQIKNPSVVMNTSTGLLAKTVYNDSKEPTDDQSIEMNKPGQDPVESAAPAAPNSQNLTNNFSSLNINKSIDPNGKKINYENAAKAIQDENQKKVLMLKLEVKQKARELIEKQIKDQKLLLQKFEQAKTVEEKTQILELVKQLSQSIEKEKEILNNKSFETPTTPPFNSSPFTFQKMASQKNMIIPPPVHHLKLNNKRLNNTNFLKSQANHSIKSASAAVVAAVPKPVAVQSQHLAGQFSYSKVDNRPRNLLFTGIENIQEKTNLLNFIKMVGCQVETVNDFNNESNGPLSFSIIFATRKDAEIALAKCSAYLNGKLVSITWGKAEAIEQKPKEKENTATSDSELAGSKTVESKALLSADEYDDDSKSKDKPLDANESTNESEQPTELEQKEFVDALFDDSTNYENLLS